MQSPTNPSAKQILILDDSAAFRSLLSNILGNAGFVCRKVANATDGFMALLGDDVDLVITDLNMPGVDGYSFLAAASLLSARPPIIVVSSDADAPGLQGRTELRTAFALLRKPISAPELIRTVLAALDINEPPPAGSTA